MTDFTIKKLKTEFINYFKSKDHNVIKSSSVVPSNDPSLLFTNSGMVQFKSILMGQPSEYKRACSIQRCIRAGGKHNDLDDVGKDTYHHTYFEMMGNWSFGDYFKKEAIEYAWDFLVNILKMDEKRLYVTYYKDMDTESYNIWKTLLPDSRIIEAGKKDNFWEMGDTGPCGPCTEIHYDRIGHRDASHLVNMDDPDVIEIWNIVFIEFNRTSQGLESLERKCIDTGIGFERLLSILNNVRSNYLTPCFLPLINKLEKMSGKIYEDKFSVEDTAFRAVSDHCRTIAACLFDNVEFSNDGQGYVLRRILRRAVRYAHDILKLKRGSLSLIIREILKEIIIEDMESEVLINKLSSEEIQKSIEELNMGSGRSRIEKLIKEIDIEEDKFLETLQKGLERFKKMCNESDVISSEEIFRLYDTYGFPTDLVQMLAEENNVKLDFSTFEEVKENARELSKKVNNEITEIILRNVPVTDDQYKYTTNGICANLQFYLVGRDIVRIDKESGFVYNEEYSSSFEKISNITRNSKKLSSSPPEDTKIGLVFDRSCFYSECGGQVGDTGLITFYDDNIEIGKFTVSDTKKINGYVVHYGILKGEISNSAILEFDDRSDIEANHTGVHLFNYFLRHKIDTVQRGSLVAKNKFRFDFEGKKIDLKEIEENINKLISKGHNVTVSFVEKYKLKNEKDLIYMKNEDYPQVVRVISVDNTKIRELCGGTHVKNLGDIYKVKIVSEGSISSNVRRVVGITGEEVKKAEKAIQELESEIDDGKVVKIDKNLPMFDRIRLEEKVKINLDNINEVKKENYKKNLMNLKMKIAVTRDYNKNFDINEISFKDLEIILRRNQINNLSERSNLIFESVNMEYEVSAYETKKDILKNVTNLIKVFEDKDDFFVYFKFEDSVYGFIRQYNTEKIMEDLKKKFTDGFYKMNKDVLQFNFKTNKKDLNSLFIQLNFFE
jgi:alanyl-tRNA synthetase